MPDYKLGRLHDRFVVTWTDPDTGKRRRHRLDAATPQEAESAARDLIRTLAPPPATAIVADIWRAYALEMGSRRQAGKLADVARVVLPHFGHLRPDQITQADCRTYTAARADHGRRDGTIRTELGCLRTALRWAAKTGRIASAPAIAMPQTPQPRDRYLTADEVQALLAAAVDPHLRLAIILMVTTAARIGAILDLTWDRVDLERRQIRLAKADIGPRKGRATVPINDSAMAALTVARQAALSNFVIEWAAGPVGSIKRGFAAAVTRSGIAHCTPHDLRRTAGRLMAEAGVPLDEIAQYLGHTSTAVTRSTYAKFSPDYLRKAAGAVDIFGAPGSTNLRAIPKSRPKSLK